MATVSSKPQDMATQEIERLMHAAGFGGHITTQAAGAGHTHTVSPQQGGQRYEREATIRALLTVMFPKVTVFRVHEEAEGKFTVFAHNTKDPGRYAVVKFEMPPEASGVLSLLSE